MYLDEIDTLKLKELHPSNKLLNRVYGVNNLFSFVGSNQKFYLANEFELQSEKLLVVFSTYESFDINAGKRVTNKQFHIMNPKDFANYVTEIEDEDQEYKTTYKYMKENGIIDITYC